MTMCSPWVVRDQDFQVEVSCDRGEAHVQTLHGIMPPLVNFTPRSSLDSKIHPTVDGVLKELKSASRELQKVLTSFRLELELLDRLFYKNKNQHRGALFWRKVTEMRRFGHKLGHYKPDGLVEDARRWFWGPLDQQR